MKKKNVKVNDKKTKNIKIKDKNKLIIYVVVATLLIISVGTLVITNKEKRGEWVTLEEENKKEVLTGTDYYSIMNYQKLNTLPDEYYGYFYKNNKVEAKDIDNKVKLYMAIRKVAEEQKLGDIEKEIKIKESDIAKAIKEIFGNKIEYKNESLNGNACSYTNFKYDKKSKTYIQEPGDCTDDSTDTILDEVISTTEENNIVKVQEKVGFVETSYNLETKKLSYNIYKDVDKKEKVATVDSYSIDSCKDSLNTYQYTFKKDNNHYYLESIEMIVSE